MLRHIILVLTVAVLAGISAIATGSSPPATPPPATSFTVTDNRSCASDCQAAHDQCRVQRKGSPSCDAERQACLEKCLQKKKR
ncbi:MAG: hypothetical protein SFW09_05605 [Hyphomicrobiaceae bacterium]|nr:hypothetical protein [Hyphomicrobiaceae bacterium]